MFAWLLYIASAAEPNSDGSQRPKPILIEMFPLGILRILISL